MLLRLLILIAGAVLTCGPIAASTAQALEQVTLRREGKELHVSGELLVEAEDVRRTGSAALDLAWTACGRADAYFEAGLQPWDIAAGVLLVREAGGRVCDFRGRGERLLDGGQVVAGNLKLCDALQKAVVSSGYASAFN